MAERAPGLEAACAWLRGTRAPEGRCLDPVEDALALLAGGDLAARYRLVHGSDVWHSVMALRALRLAGEDDAPLRDAILRATLPGGGLPHWAAQGALCVETSCAAARLLPEQREATVALLERHALRSRAGATWASPALGESGGWMHYLAGPSVSAWALGVLPAGHILAEEARAYLAATRQDGVWRAHDAFYGTGLYTAWRAAAADASQVDGALLGWLRAGQLPAGGWGFAATPDASATLTTAWALEIAVAAGVAADDPLRVGARAWFGRAQQSDGRFASGVVPESIFYTGDLLATSCAVAALAKDRA